MKEYRGQDARPTLVLTVGLPRSGKSTWARDMDYPIVCPDEIRLALHGKVFIKEAEPYVWAIAHTMVKALFGSRHSHVILDATNLSWGRRDEWRSEDWHRVAKTFRASTKECIKRAERTGRTDLIPVIGRMANGAEWPDAGEISLWFD
jgi:predicted kinase